jgi:predicted GIY-YIG superfamily endonuclease
VENQKFYVYILKGNYSRFYTGRTKNLTDRSSRHNRGSVPYTKNIRPLKLITYIVFTDEYLAISFEKYLKSGSGRAFMKRHLI